MHVQSTLLADNNRAFIQFAFSPHLRLSVFKKQLNVGKWCVQINTSAVAMFGRNFNKKILFRGEGNLFITSFALNCFAWRKQVFMSAFIDAIPWFGHVKALATALGVYLISSKIFSFTIHVFCHLFMVEKIRFLEGNETKLNKMKTNWVRFNANFSNYTPGRSCLFRTC